MYTIEVNGVKVECSTASEAIALINGLRDGYSAPKGTASQSGSPAPPAQNPAGGSRWNPDRFKQFCNRLADNQKTFLREIVGSPHGVMDTALRQKLGLSTNKAFGPIVTAISRHAKFVGVSLDDVLESKNVQLGTEWALEYKASPSFLRVAAEAGGIM